MTTPDRREQLTLDLEVALVDWKGFAQPHELAQLAELLLDAKDAATELELEQLAAQFRSLERFVASRRASTAVMSAVRPTSKP